MFVFRDGSMGTDVIKFEIIVWFLFMQVYICKCVCLCLLRKNMLPNFCGGMAGGRRTDILMDLPCVFLLRHLYLNFTSNFVLVTGYYCPEGQVSPTPGDYLCPTGHYCEANSPVPTRCDDGYYQDNIGTDECIQCEPGKAAIHQKHGHQLSWITFSMVVVWNLLWN